MIRPRLALTRQAQEMFRSHLVGIYQWDEVKFVPREKRDIPPMSSMTRQERAALRADRPEGKYLQEVSFEFGIWAIHIQSPAEHPPLGWVTLDGVDKVEGPLDPAIWDKIGLHIKQKSMELKDGTAEHEWS
jgi:hypothetical protein